MGKFTGARNALDVFLPLSIGCDINQASVVCENCNPFPLFPLFIQEKNVSKYIISTMSLYCHAGQAPGLSSYCLPLPPPSLLFVPPPVMRTSVPSRFPRPLTMKMRDSPRQKHAQWKEDEMELWKARRGISRSFLKPVGMLTRRRDRLIRARMGRYEEMAMEREREGYRNNKMEKMVAARISSHLLEQRCRAKCTRRVP